MGETSGAPGRDILHSLVDMAAAGLPPTAQRARRTVVETGTAHVVVLLHGSAAVRVGRVPGAASVMRKRQQLVDSIPAAVGFLLPRSLGPVVELHRFSAVATELIPGAPCRAGEGDPRLLQDLLARVSALDPAPLRGLLAEPLAFCGGADWFRIQCEEVIPRLAPDVRAAALAAAGVLRRLDPAREVVSHGDLGGHNVFWEGGRITGVLDWDLASLSDRSTDLACVGAWNGWDKLPLIAGTADVARAAARRNTFRLQQAAFAILNGMSPGEVGRAVGRADAWFRERRGGEPQARENSLASRTCSGVGRTPV